MKKYYICPVIDPALYSQYIIDGVPQESTPAQLLESVSVQTLPERESLPEGRIVDETLDQVLGLFNLRNSKIDEYARLVSGVRRVLPVSFAGNFTSARLASALLDVIWRAGHFTLQDLELKAEWKWNPAPVGSNAAFYDSVHAATDYMDALGLGLRSYTYERARRCDVAFKAVLSGSARQGDMFARPDKVRPRLVSGSACPQQIQCDPRSWLIYVPFDPADFRLGGSLLAQTLGLGGGVAPKLGDADYFIDCYEVVRELVEDGIVMSGVSVGDGGLMQAASRLCEGACGATLDLAPIVQAYEDDNLVRILFGEIPGVLLQIDDSDFDYIDAEFLLQDVAYYPIGHPSVRATGVKVRATASTGIQNILSSLLRSGGAEGED